MARFVVHIRTNMSPTAAFEFMANLANFERWDPGVVASRQIAGDGPGAEAVFEVEVKSVGGSMTLEYHTTEYEEPRRVTAVAESSMLTSNDRIRVEPEGDGCVVTYDAELTLNGVLGIADPLLALAFRRIGERAAEGLIEALDGERLTR